jgi:hypothetical protein
MPSIRSSKLIGAQKRDAMNGINVSPRRGVLAVIATMAVALGFVVLGAPMADAAPDCSISRFQNPDGSVDVTGYAQCTSPSVSETTVAPGGTITFSGGGFAATSDVTITIFPAGQVLGTAVTDDSGNFSVEVVVPADTPLGTNRLEASGVDPEGNPLTVSQTITVSTGEGEEVLGTSVTPSGSLPYTGSDVGRIVGVGLAALAVGGAAIWGARRARASSGA